MCVEGQAHLFEIPRGSEVSVPTPDRCPHPSALRLACQHEPSPLHPTLCFGHHGHWGWGLGNLVKGKIRWDTMLEFENARS